MSKTTNSKIHIFLVQPLSINEYKEMIVYADDEQQARAAASKVKDPEKTVVPANDISSKTIYLDGGMSICIEIEPDLLKIGNDLDLDQVQVKYNEVNYDLTKQVAQKVIAE